jgi:HK97 family phage major capsid protein
VFLCKAQNGKRTVTVLSAPLGGPYNGRDAHNQRFSQRTNFHLDKYGLPPLVYYHGWKPDGRPAQSPVYIGKTTRVWTDERGVWHEGELFDDIPEADLVWEEGLGNRVMASTGTSPLARVWPDGEIAEWPIVELTLVNVDSQRKVANPYAVVYTGDKLPPHLVKARQADEELATAEEMDEQDPHTEETMFIFKTLMFPEPASAGGGVAQDAPPVGASGAAETTAVPIDVEALAKAIFAMLPQAPAPAAEANQAPAPAGVEELVKAEVEKRMATYVGNNGGAQMQKAQQPAPLTEDKLIKAAVDDLNRGFNRFFRYGDRSGLEKVRRETVTADWYTKAVQSQNPLALPLVKALTAGTATEGAEFVPETWSKDVYAEMIEGNVFQQMRDRGAVRWENIAKTREHNLPKRTRWTAATAVIAEGASIPTPEPGSDKYQWFPYANKFIVKVSDEFLQDEDVDAWGQVIVPSAAEAMNVWQNHNFTIADGSSKPHGVLHASTLGDTAASTTAITAQELLDVYHSIPHYKRMGAGVNWMMNDTVLATLRGLVYPSTENTLMVEERPDGFYLINKPIVINSLMPAATAGLKPIAFGNFREYSIYTFDSGMFSMTRLAELYKGTGEIGFSFAQRHDAVLLDTGAVKHLIMAAGG